MLIHQKTRRPTKLLPSLAEIRWYITWRLGSENDHWSFQGVEEYAYFWLGWIRVAEGWTLGWTQTQVSVWAGCRHLLTLTIVFFSFFFNCIWYCSCPQLKGIFTNIGSRPLDPRSTLFSFSNLTNFSLIVRHGLGGSGKYIYMHSQFSSLSLSFL